MSIEKEKTGGVSTEKSPIQSLERTIRDLQHPRVAGAQARVRFPFEAGVAVRGSMIKSLRQGCFNNHVECSVDETKSWLSSLYMIKLEGTSEDIVLILQWIRYIEQEG